MPISRFDVWFCDDFTIDEKLSILKSNEEEFYHIVTDCCVYCTGIAIVDLISKFYKE